MFILAGGQPANACTHVRWNLDPRAAISSAPRAPALISLSCRCELILLQHCNSGSPSYGKDLRVTQDTTFDLLLFNPGLRDSRVIPASAHELNNIYTLIRCVNDQAEGSFMSVHSVLGYFWSYNTTCFVLRFCFIQKPGGSSSSTILKKLWFPPAPAEENQQCQSDNRTPNSTPLLMSDEANCGNGLLLFGSDKYCDK